MITRQHILGCLACLAVATAAVLAFGSPARELQAAVAHAELHPGQGWRYVTTYAVKPEDRPKAEIAINWWLNMLLHERRHVRWTKITETLYGIPLASVVDASRVPDWNMAWRVVSASDHAFSVTGQVLIEGKIQTVQAPGGWAGLAEAGRLAAATGTKFPLLDARQWLVDSSRAGAYYQMVGVPGRREDWFAKLGAVGAAAGESIRAANLTDRGPTRKPGRIVLRAGVSPVWITRDPARIQADRDPIRRPVNTAEIALVHDAEEHIASVNGWPVYALFDAAGNRQDTAPQNVAVDKHAEAEGFLLQAGISCARCHIAVGGESLWAFSDETLPPDTAFYARPDVALTFADIYGDPEALEIQRQFHNAQAERVTRRAVGVPIQEAAKAHRWAYESYIGQVDFEQACREAGVHPMHALKVLPASTDPHIRRLLGGETVHREMWASSFQEFAITCGR